MGFLPRLLFAAILFFAPIAHADDVRVPHVSLSDFFPPRLRIEASGGWHAAHAPGVNLNQLRYTLAPEFMFAGLVEVVPTFTMTQTEVDLRHQQGLPFDMTMTMPWQPSLGGRLGVNVIRWQWFRVSLRAEFDMPFGSNAAHIDSFRPQGDFAAELERINELMAVTGKDWSWLLAQGLPNSMRLEHRWYSTQAVVTVGAQFYWLQPSIDLGVLSFHQSISIAVIPELQELLHDLDVTLRTRYQTDTVVPIIAPGIRIDLGRGVEIRLRGIWLSSKDFSFTTVDAALVLPIDL